MSVKFITWLWKQNPDRHNYNAEKINRWFEQFRANLTIDATFACVTDMPEGIDPRVEIIPPPKLFEDVKCAGWSESIGAPQCYRRLSIYHPDAAEIFGAEWLVQSDADVAVIRNLDSLFTKDYEFRIFNGTASSRPYNGGLVMLRAGARPQIWERFSADPFGVAKDARRKYVGSDQAVISYILGPGEMTWGETDGVYYHSPRVIRQHGGMTSPPANMRMLFFPGHIKPWHNNVAQPWMKAAWEGKDLGTSIIAAKRYKPGEKMRFRAYKDPKGWGVEFIRSAMKRGIFCTAFNHSRSVHNGAAFVRLDQQGSQREISKKLVEELCSKGIMTLPTLREARWYDDKGAQLEPLRQWMPRTVMARTKSAAYDLLPSMTYPFVSKAIDGSASKCVRLIRNEGAAKAEIEAAFRAPGIETVYGRRQFNYVYWQEFIPDNNCDYRVCVVGDYAYGLVRRVRRGSFTASGSGDHYPIMLVNDYERRAMELGVEIANKLETDWMAFDIVFTKNFEPKVLEMSSAWTMKAYAQCPVYSRKDLKLTPRTGAESFDIAVEVLERMWQSA